MKLTVVCALLVITLCVTQTWAQAPKPSPLKFLGCVRRTLGWSALFNSHVRCSAWELFKVCATKIAKRCANCDRYFYCLGNKNAVINCQSSDTNRETGRAVSECREFAQGNVDTPDVRAARAAGDFGRGGGDCESRYLCDVNCTYDPHFGSCRASNCNSD